MIERFGSKLKSGLLLMTLITLLGAVLMAVQQRSPVPTIGWAAIRGDWALHIHEGDEALPPPPPPVYVSQRGHDTLPPIETIPRVLLRFEEERPSGEIVLPKGFLEGQMEEALSAPVDLVKLEFDGRMLRFEAESEGKRIRAELRLNQNRFLGKWSMEPERGGNLFLVKRLR